MRRGAILCAYLLPAKGGDRLKFLHVSDLHLGRRLYDASLLEDQQVILQQILDLIDSHGADGVLLAGDIYDKPVPSAEAVRLLDWFLTQLANRDLPVFLVSGNHDSAERISFGSQLLDGSRVYVSPVFEKPTEPVSLHDAHGEVRIYMLPFIKPIHVRKAMPEVLAETYTDAVEAVIAAWKPDPDCRNILVAHQLVTGAVRSESETVSIGGLDDVSAEVFAPFDYVALGHLHRAQSVQRLEICYSGSPLAYSFSEGDCEKSVTWVELGEKGEVTVTQTPLKPLHPVRTLRGTFEMLMQDGSDDYLRLILTNEDDIPNALGRLRDRYPNLLRLEYDNLRTRAQAKLEPLVEESLSPMELLSRFYELRNNQPMSPEQAALAKDWMEQIWEGET